MPPKNKQIADDEKLRLPSTKKMLSIKELLEEDEDYRFNRIKVHRTKPRFELPDPTDDDRDNVATKPTFKAVVLVARKNFFQGQDEKDKGQDPKEKRALYVLRPGKLMPELLYINPTSLINWKSFAKAVVQSGNSLFGVMCEFSAEFINNKKSGFSWNKVKFAIDRTLTPEELEHAVEMRTLVDQRVKDYEDTSDLDKYEDQLLGNEADDDDVQDKHSKKARRQIEDDEDDDPKAKKPGAKGKKGKPDPDDDDDDEEEVKPKGKKASKPDPDDDDDDEEEVKPKGKKAAKKPDLEDDDDDDEEEVKPKGKKSGSAALDLDDDDDDLEELTDKKKAAKGKKGKPDPDDDDDEEEVKPKGKKTAKSLDDDDDDED